MIVASVSNKVLRSGLVLRSRDNDCLRYAEKANHRTRFDDGILRVAPDGRETIKNSALLGRHFLQPSRSQNQLFHFFPFYG